MNEEQEKMYADGFTKRAVVGARMYGAMKVWVGLSDALLSPFLKARMAEFVADYEKAQAVIDKAMAPAVQTQLSDAEAKPVSYAAEFVADSTGKFCGNLLRFATEAEALTYARDLAMRWTSVTDFRAVESTDPVTVAIIDDRLEFLKDKP